MPPDCQLNGADEIGAWIERLWLVHRHRRVNVSAKAVRYAVKHRGLQADKIGRCLVMVSVDVTAWWQAQYSTGLVHVGRLGRDSH